MLRIYTRRMFESEARSEVTSYIAHALAHKLLMILLLTVHTFLWVMQSLNTIVAILVDAYQIP